MQDVEPIVVCGFPKSGTTWVVRLLGSILDCPVQGYLGYDGRDLSKEGSGRISSYECYKSHDGLNAIKNYLPDIKYLVYVIRDPRDIIVSGAHHFNLLPEKFIAIRNTIHKLPFGIRYFKKVLLPAVSHNEKLKLFYDIVVNGSANYPGCNHSWTSHISQFQNQNIFRIQYEKLIQSPFLVCKELLEYLGMDIDSKHVEYAIRQESFATRKQSFLEEKDIVKYNHLRSGRPGDWRQVLPESMLNELYNEIGHIMMKEGYQFNSSLE